MLYEYNSSLGTPLYTPAMAKRDGKRAVAGFRARKASAQVVKLEKSCASRAKAVSVMAAMGIIQLTAQSFV